MIRRLSHFLDIPADVLIQPYKIMQSRQRPRHKTKKSVQRQNHPARAA
jgi:hypothetical protein